MLGFVLGMRWGNDVEEFVLVREMWCIEGVGRMMYEVVMEGCGLYF